MILTAQRVAPGPKLALVAIPLVAAMRRPVVYMLRLGFALLLMWFFWYPLWTQLRESGSPDFTLESLRSLAARLEIQVAMLTGGIVLFAAPIAAVCVGRRGSHAHRQLLALAPAGRWGLVAGRFLGAMALVEWLYLATVPFLCLANWLGTSDLRTIVISNLVTLAFAAPIVALTVLLDALLRRPVYAAGLTIVTAAVLLREMPLDTLSSDGAVWWTVDSLSRAQSMAGFYDGVADVVAKQVHVGDLYLALSLLPATVLLLGLAGLVSLRPPRQRRKAPAPWVLRRSQAARAAAPASAPAWAAQPLLWVEWRRLRPSAALSIGKLTIAVPLAVLAVHTLLDGALDFPFLYALCTGFWVMVLVVIPLAWAVARARLLDTDAIYLDVLPLGHAERAAGKFLPPLLLSLPFLAGMGMHVLLHATFAELGWTRAGLVALGFVLSSLIVSTLFVSLAILVKRRRHYAALAALAPLLFPYCAGPRILGAAWAEAWCLLPGPHAFLAGVGIDFSGSFASLPVDARAYILPLLVYAAAAALAVIFLMHPRFSSKERR